MCTYVPVTDSAKSRAASQADVATERTAQASHLAVLLSPCPFCDNFTA